MATDDLVVIQIAIKDKIGRVKDGSFTRNMDMLSDLIILSNYLKQGWEIVGTHTIEDLRHFILIYTLYRSLDF